MRYETVEKDITVIGGGLAGVCAAVAAARLGSKVALIQNRPVLGGNSSSEVRVWVCGATAHGIHRNARETGIMGELFVENQYRNPEGNPYYWDLVVLEKVKAEPNIELFLNTDVHEVEAEGDEDNRIIRSVTGWMMASERKITFRSRQYIDCTGDGLVGFLAGAKYRIGREARHEYNEAWAPETGDDITLGSTILFYSRDEGKPVKYVPPSFAKDIAKTSIPIRRVIRSGDSGCHYWWIEWGGEHDTVHDNERIRDELWSVIYGIWDYIKNSGQFDADNMTLEWVGSVPGKREYRRFTGDYVLNQNDILAQRAFHDRVAFGGWSIDLHPPGGMYAEESGSKHLHTNGIYHIPFRSLYSVNVSNMLMAGRNISASHVAFGTTRVMATCAVIGEAAGTGAALCVKRGVSPRVIAERHMEELQQTLLRQDAAVVGIASSDSNDRARAAKVEASSWMREIAVEKSCERQPLEHDFGIVFPMNQITEVELLLDIGKRTTVEIELWSTERGENYVPHKLLAQASAVAEPGENRWVPFRLELHTENTCNAFLIVKSNPHAALHLSHEPMSGVLSFYHAGAARAAAALEEHDFNQLTVQWNARKHIRKPACLRVHGECNAYQPRNLIDGYKRPFGGPHMWVSEETGGEEWLMLSWEQPIAMSEIAITFNDDVDEDLINLHHHRTPFDIMPELVKDYSLEALVDGQWRRLLRVADNRIRQRVHRLEQQMKTSAIRLVMESTNGCPRYEVVEVRVYE